jgi:uncharacterized protein
MRPVRLDIVEFVSKDPAATQEFQEKAFGLKFAVLGPELAHYRVHGKAKGAAASEIGLRAPEGAEPTGTISSLTVENIDVALERARAEGGTVIVEKTEIPEIGFMATFVAPGGVTIGLWRYKQST